jgi:archaellum biogenesis protein FlaJ (TadC family)
MMLNRHEKLAIFNLSILAVAILLSFLIWQTMGISRAYAGFAIFAFLGIGHLIFLRKKTPSEVIEDERDTSIKLISLKGALSFVFGYFVIASLAVYYSHSDTGVVSIDFFPLFVWVGWALLVLVSSIITLIQYRRGTNCGIC